MAFPEMYFRMDAAQAARFYADTCTRQFPLEPRLATHGPYKGAYLLPERLAGIEKYADQRAALLMCPVVAVDPDVAWPQQPEV